MSTTPSNALQKEPDDRQALQQEVARLKARVEELELETELLQEGVTLDALKVNVRTFSNGPVTNSAGQGSQVCLVLP